MLETFFVSSELSTLRSEPEISASFAILTQAEQDQVRAECATMDATESAGGTSFGDATSGEAASAGSEGAMALDDSAGGASDAAVAGDGAPETVPSESGATSGSAANTDWLELCAIVGAL